MALVRTTLDPGLRRDDSFNVVSLNSKVTRSNG